MACCVADRVVKLWRESLSKVNQKAAESLADPTEYENLFPGLKEAFLAEQYLKETCLGKSRPATDYPLVTVRDFNTLLSSSASLTSRSSRMLLLELLLKLMSSF